MNHSTLAKETTYNVERWSVQNILDCVNSPTNRIQVQPPEFQRDFIASIDWSRNLVDSLLNGFSSNLIHFRKLSQEQSKKVGFSYQCLDGLQRISSIINFIDNKFVDNRGRTFKEYPETLKEKLLKYSFFVFVYNENMTDEEAGDTFVRINNANDLNDQEILNAMPGAVSQIVRSLARLGNPHEILPLFRTTPDSKGVQRPIGGIGMLRGNRLAYDSLIARFFAVEYDRNRHPDKKAYTNCYINYALIKQMYTDPALKCLYDSEGNPIALDNYMWTEPTELTIIRKEVERKTNIVHGLVQKDPMCKKVFKNTGTINLLYDLIYAVEEKFGKKSIKNELNFIRGVMSIHSHHLNGMTKEHSQFYTRLLGCGSPAEINEKLEIYTKEFSADPERFGIVPMDNTRISDAEKMHLLTKQNFKCWMDGEDLTIDEAEAAHIVARALGGKNKPSNYVIMRKVYNRQMGTMEPVEFQRIHFPHRVVHNEQG